MAAAIMSHTMPKPNCRGSANPMPSIKKNVPRAEKGSVDLKSFIAVGLGFEKSNCGSLEKIKLLKRVKFRERGIRFN